MPFENEATSAGVSTSMLCLRPTLNSIRAMKYQITSQRWSNCAMGGERWPKSWNA